MRKTILIFTTVIFGIIISGCWNIKEYTGGDIVHKNVSFKTQDGITILGDLYKGGNTGIILLHMYTATRQTWKEFAQELQKNGYSVLAIDLRGHGESDLDYNRFAEKDFNDMTFDVKAAKRFLGKNKTIVIGASIGANTALKFANEVDGVVALSPSFNYKGIKTKDIASAIKKPVLIITSEEDVQSVGDSKELNKIIFGSTLKVYRGKDHGTRMLDKETKDLITKWLEKL